MAVRSVGRSVGAVIAGMVAGVTLTLATDVVLHKIGRVSVITTK